MGKRYKSKKERGFFVLKVVLLLCLIILLGGGYVYGQQALDKFEEARTVIVTADAQQLAEKLYGDKVSKLKTELLEDLSIGCEVRGAKEPDSVIILDSNNAASLGRFQFQIKTVQHYYKSIYNKDITRKEAILVALDKDKATMLAGDIIFGDDMGLKNWINCGNKLNLRERVKMINNL